MSRTIRNRNKEEKEIKNELYSLKRVKEVFEKTGDEKVFFSHYQTSYLINCPYYSKEDKIASINGTIDYYLRRLNRLRLDRACTHQEYTKYASNIVRKTGRKNIINQVKKTRLENIQYTDFNNLKEEKKCKKIKWMFSD